MSEYADQRAHDVAWMTAEERGKHHVCPDCGRPIEKNQRSAEGLWNHVEMVNDCWRISYDGPEPA